MTASKVKWTMACIESNNKLLKMGTEVSVFRGERNAHGYEE